MNRIRKLRKKRNLSIDQLSKELKKQGVNISSASISKYERGVRNPKIENWIKLADFFDVPILYLQGTSEYTNDDEKEIDKLKPLAFDKNHKLNWDVMSKIMNIDADLSEGKEIKREFESANKIIDSLFLHDQEKNKYKKIIANSKLSDKVGNFPEPVSTYTFILSVVSEMFFKAQSGDSTAKKCIQEIEKIYDEYDTHITNEAHKKWLGKHKESNNGDKH